VKIYEGTIGQSSHLKRKEVFFKKKGKADRSSEHPKKIYMEDSRVYAKRVKGLAMNCCSKRILTEGNARGNGRDVRKKKIETTSGVKNASSRTRNLWIL